MNDLKKITINGVTYDVAPGSHLEDKNNPHGLTAEQVGARPDTWMPTAEQVGARPDTWMPTAEQVGARPDTWMPTASDVGAAPASLIYKHISTSGDADELAQIDAIVAERGNKYGIQNAFFLKVNRTVSEGATGGLGGGDYIYTVKTIASNYVWIMAERPVANGLRAHRWKIDGVWTDNWEWDNPLMTVGREYRTTERWNEKAVYTKLINFGSLPVGTSATPKAKSVDSGILYSKIVEMRTNVYSDDIELFTHSPLIANAGYLEYKTHIFGTKIEIVTTGDYSGFYAHVLLKYTKD